MPDGHVADMRELLNIHLTSTGAKIGQPPMSWLKAVAYPCGVGGGAASVAEECCAPLARWQMNIMYMLVTCAVFQPPMSWLKAVAWYCGVGGGAASVAEERRATLLALADEHGAHARHLRCVEGERLVEGGGAPVRSRERSGERG